MPVSKPAASPWPWILLPGRLVLFILFQALFSLAYAQFDAAATWDRSSAWWPATVSLTNFMCLFLLVHLYRQEGRRFWDLFRVDRAHIKGDLLALLVSLIITVPVALLPNTLLATALYGDPMKPMYQFLAPLPPVGVAVALILFPLTQGLVELAFYFLYIMPRLAQKINPWAAYALASLFLGLQHLAIPLRFDARFFTWRALMFIPFAFLIGGILKWRPRLLPYLAAIHALMDLSMAVMYITGF